MTFLGGVDTRDMREGRQTDVLHDCKSSFNAIIPLRAAARSGQSMNKWAAKVLADAAARH